MIHLEQSKDGQYFFTVTAANGKVLVTSETYKTKQGRDKGVKALVKIIKKL